MYYELYKDVVGQYRWRLRSANHRIIANSGEGYHNKSDCRDAIRLVKSSASAPVHDNT